MKIYFSGSIYGGRQKLDAYQTLMKELKKYEEILNEEVADPKVIEKEEGVLDETIFKNLENILKIADLVFAELTIASLGVGYELGFADKLNKKIIGIYDETITPKLSTMIRGNKRIKIIPYTNLDEIIDNLENILKED